MNHLNLLLSQNEQARDFFMGLSEQQQALLIQSSDAVRSLSDMKQVLHRWNSNPSAE